MRDQPYPSEAAERAPSSVSEVIDRIHDKLMESRDRATAVLNRVEGMGPAPSAEKVQTGPVSLLIRLEQLDSVAGAVGELIARLNNRI